MSAAELRRLVDEQRRDDTRRQAPERHGKGRHRVLPLYSMNGQGRWLPPAPSVEEQDIEQHEPDVDAPQTEGQLIRDALTYALTQVADTLTPDERDVLVAVYWHGMSVRDAARQLHTSKSTIDRRKLAAERKIGALVAGYVAEARADETAGQGPCGTEAD